MARRSIVRTESGFDRKEAYNLGDNEFHLAFDVDDMDAAHELHKKMGCICFENPAMGIYFINDPDGYWIEFIPRRIMDPIFVRTARIMGEEGVDFLSTKTVVVLYRRRRILCC